MCNCFFWTYAKFLKSPVSLLIYFFRMRFFYYFILLKAPRLSYEKLTWFFMCVRFCISNVLNINDSRKYLHINYNCVQILFIFPFVFFHKLYMCTYTWPQPCCFNVCRRGGGAETYAHPPLKRLQKRKQRCFL